MTKPYFDENKPETEYPSILTEPRPEEAKNVRLVAHSDLNGWGDAFQVRVRDGLCYVMGLGSIRVERAHGPGRFRSFPSESHTTNGR